MYSWNLYHPNFNDANSANFGIICFDNVNLASWYHRKEWLRGNICFSKAWTETWVSNKISMACRITLLDNSSNRCSPSMITPRIEEALVNSSSNKVLFKVILLFLRKWVSVKHLSQRVFMVLKPKLILPLGIVVGRAIVRIWLWVIYNLIFIIIHWSCLLLDFASKPIMPALKTIVRGTWIANKIIVVDSFQGLWA